jgi:putative Mg2+ transporter-C (MgtC) family protein
MVSNPNDVLVAIRLFLAVLLCGFIGYEREKTKGKGYAGLRTHMLVGLGASLVTMAGMYAFPLVIGSGSNAVPGADPTRIAAGILSGMGFLGAGTIIASGGRVKGLTTAASLWLAAGIGIAVGAGFIRGAILATIFALIILQLWRVEKRDEHGNYYSVIP